MSIDRVEILSIIKKWNDDSETVQRYAKKHGWLKADVLKLENCIRRYRLTNIALTTTGIYGLANGETPFATGRANFGIADNFS